MKLHEVIHLVRSGRAKWLYVSRDEVTRFKYNTENHCFMRYFFDREKQQPYLINERILDIREYLLRHTERRDDWLISNGDIL